MQSDYQKYISKWPNIISNQSSRSTWDRSFVGTKLVITNVLPYKITKLVITNSKSDFSYATWFLPSW